MCVEEGEKGRFRSGWWESRVQQQQHSVGWVALFFFSVSLSFFLSFFLSLSLSLSLSLYSSSRPYRWWPKRKRGVGARSFLLPFRPSVRLLLLLLFLLILILFCCLCVSVSFIFLFINIFSLSLSLLFFFYVYIFFWLLLLFIIIKVVDVLLFLFSSFFFFVLFCSFLCSVLVQPPDPAGGPLFLICVTWFQSLFYFCFVFAFRLIVSFAQTWLFYFYCVTGEGFERWECAAPSAGFIISADLIAGSFLHLTDLIDSLRCSSSLGRVALFICPLSTGYDQQ